ncbi:MAG: tetratricopeptide repeat protein [Pseudomonadota bacterium]
MKARLWLHNHIVAALVLIFVGCGAAIAQDAARLDDLFTRLTTATEGEAGRIEREIWLEWSKSGSPAMDLLLQRGRDAMEAGDTDAAIQHFTALIDHAPDFAEGWNARATAYFTAGEFGPSIADIARTLTLNPRHFGAMAGMATILEQLGKPEQALKMWRAALAIHPYLGGVDEAIKRLEKDAEGQEL